MKLKFGRHAFLVMIHTCPKIKQIKRGHVSQVCQSYRKCILKFEKMKESAIIFRDSYADDVFIT